MKYTDINKIDPRYATFISFLISREGQSERYEKEVLKGEEYSSNPDLEVTLCINGVHFDAKAFVEFYWELRDKHIEEAAQEKFEAEKRKFINFVDGRLEGLLDGYEAKSE